MDPRESNSQAVWWILGIPLGLVLLLALVILYPVMRRAYWDMEVRDLCHRDGGVVVLEPVVVSAEQWERLPRVEGAVGVPADFSAGRNFPAFYVASETVIHRKDPQVIRRESSVIRASDKKIIGRMIEYLRIGGDPPIVTFHPSSFSCPDERTMIAAQSKFFVLQGSNK